MKTVTIFTTGFTLTAIAASDSWALGLGDLTLNSYLNEPISAQIELLDAGAIDESDVRISLAPPQSLIASVLLVAFISLRFALKSRPLNEASLWLLSAAEPLREPYLEFVVEARWPTGRLLKDYTVLIDLPPEPLSQSDVSCEHSEAVAGQRCGLPPYIQRELRERDIETAKTRFSILGENDGYALVYSDRDCARWRND